MRGGVLIRLLLWGKHGLVLSVSGQLVVKTAWCVHVSASIGRLLVGMSMVKPTEPGKSRGVSVVREIECERCVDPRDFKVRVRSTVLASLYVVLGKSWFNGSGVVDVAECRCRWIHKNLGLRWISNALLP